MTRIEVGDRPIREVNGAVRAALKAGKTSITLANSAARHNLAVGLVEPCTITADGSVGYYCAGMIDGPTVTIQGHAGWGLAECMSGGEVTVRGHAGNFAGASLRGGTVVVHGHAGARAGISMKGGTLLIGGNAGMMAGFMGQKGRIVICGDAGPGVADSMYETEVFVGGRLTEMGADTKETDVTVDDRAWLTALLAEHHVKAPGAFHKIISARALWNFSKADFGVWKQAL